MCAASVSVTKRLRPGRLIFAVPDTGSTLTLLPATGGSSGGGGGGPGGAGWGARGAGGGGATGAGFRNARNVSVLAPGEDDAARSGRESPLKSAATTSLAPPVYGI